MSRAESLAPLLVDQLRDLMDAERQLTKALPKLAKASSAPELRAAFQEHLSVTEEHIQRLNEVFEQLGETARGKKCIGMKGLVEEGQEKIDETEAGPTRDAAIIAAAQSTEHYEMAGYGTCRTWAQLLGHDDVVSLLEQTLNDEKEADQKLTGIAEGLVNLEAAEEGVGEARGSARSERWAAAETSREATRRTSKPSRKNGARSTRSRSAKKR
jgi:ferritin-like metal-binding protein YciE